MFTARKRLSAAGVAAAAAPPAATEKLVLPFELRQKSRLRARLVSGRDIGLFLERGVVLRGGDLLFADDGTVIEVVAALETVSTVRDSDATRLARAGYHLGNRHVPVEIGDGWLRYGHDHVLDDMVRGLGLSVVVEQAAFEPEAGAYGHSGAHSHGSGEHSGAPSYGLGEHAGTHSHGSGGHPGAHSHESGERSGTHAHGGSPGRHSHGHSHEHIGAHQHHDDAGHAPATGFGARSTHEDHTH